MVLKYYAYYYNHLSQNYVVFRYTIFVLVFTVRGTLPDTE